MWPSPLCELRRTSRLHDSLSQVPPERAIPLGAKIEKHGALANMDAILAEADGITVARGRGWGNGTRPSNRMANWLSTFCQSGIGKGAALCGNSLE